MTVSIENCIYSVIDEASINLLFFDEFFQSHMKELVKIGQKLKIDGMMQEAHFLVACHSPNKSEG